jgi:hypothetical protein
VNSSSGLEMFNKQNFFGEFHLWFSKEMEKKQKDSPLLPPASAQWRELWAQNFCEFHYWFRNVNKQKNSPPLPPASVQWRELWAQKSCELHLWFKEM